MSRDCVLFSTADWAAPYWTNKQHVARSLARRGWRVLYCESIGLRRPRMNSARDFRRLWRRLLTGLRTLSGGPRPAEPGIWVLSPLVIPGSHHGLVQRLNTLLQRFVVSRFCRRHGMRQPLVWTYHPHMLELAGIRNGGAFIYHCVDDLGEVPGVDRERFAAAERELLRQCDIVFATAEPLADKCRKINPNTHFLPNVADIDHFRRAADGARAAEDLRLVPAPRLLYHGVLSDHKLDLPLLHALARRHGAWQFVIIGDEPEGQRNPEFASMRRLPNVHALGYRRYEELPAYLAACDVGLLPLADNAHTRGVFPMKFYEYLAAGLPVVSTPAAFTRGGHDGLAVGGGVEGFAAAIAAQLARGRLSDAESRAAVGINTWDGRMDRMEKIIAAHATQEARP